MFPGSDNAITQLRGWGCNGRKIKRKISFLIERLSEDGAANYAVLVFYGVWVASTVFGAMVARRLLPKWARSLSDLEIDTWAIGCFLLCYTSRPLVVFQNNNKKCRCATIRVVLRETPSHRIGYPGESHPQLSHHLACGSSLGGSHELPSRKTVNKIFKIL